MSELELSGAETREIVTPFAFAVHDDLLGLALARPWRRALAISVDGVLVGGLSLVPFAALLVVASVLLWFAAKKLSPKLGFLLRILAIVGVLSGGITGLASIGNQNAGLETMAHAVRVGQFRGQVEQGLCVDAACAKRSLDDLAWLVVQGAASDGDAQLSFDEYVEGLNLSPTEHAELWQLYQDAIQAHSQEQPASLKSPPAGVEIRALELQSPSSQTPLSWVQGLLQDLGLSLGWAALYFSAFLCAWSGQTPGKRLLRIRVHMLNGGRIGWWDAFSRYGGYGAGFTTGLLGFAQLYWDANRQAIQDKIAGTVVVYEARTKQRRASQEAS